MPTYRLTHLVTIKKRALPVNDFTPDTNAEVEVCRAWAEITPTGSTEIVVANQTRVIATAAMIIRWPGIAIDATMVVEDSQGLRWEIEAVNDLAGGGEYLSLVCTSAPAPVGDKTTR